MNDINQIKTRHIGIILVTLFYIIVAFALVGLFLYTYLTTPLATSHRIFGIVLGFILGFSIFYIGLGIWKGQPWARFVVILISGAIVLFNIIAYLIGRVVTISSAIYLISVVVINVLILQFMFRQKTRAHFQKETRISEVIRNIIEKYREEHRSNNKK